MPTSLTPALISRLHGEHADALFRYFWAACGHWGDAEDLAQGFFVKLARQGELPEGLREERAWLLTAARHYFLDWRRAQGRVPTATGCAQPLPERWDEPAGGDGDPDGPKLAADMLAALAELPPAQRVAAQLRFWEGASLREIADTQGVPVQTAASRLRYAVTRLREKLLPLYLEFK